MRPRKLPPVAEMAAMVEQGMTHAQIAQAAGEASGEHFATSSVTSALRRAGYGQAVARFPEEIPWRVKPAHQRQYPATMLRLLGKRRRGDELTGEQAAKLDRWLHWLSESDAVVGYAPHWGFLYVARDVAGEVAGDLPIRPAVFTDVELPRERLVRGLRAASSK